MEELVGPKPQQVPSIGRMVHFILEYGPNKGQHRPAIIVRVWAEEPTINTAVQLQVFTDSPMGEESNDCLPAVLWKTSRTHSDGHEPGSWHWPEYVPAK